MKLLSMRSEDDQESGGGDGSNSKTGKQQATNIKRLTSGSQEQEEIWEEMLEGGRHLVGMALAGTGKSSTVTEGAMRINDRSPRTRCVYLAFNKSVQEEMQAKAMGKFACMTYHGFGFKALNAQFSGLKVDDKRMWDCYDHWEGRPKVQDRRAAQVLRNGVVRVARKAKEVGAATVEELEGLVDHFQMDIGDEEMEEAVVAAVPRFLLHASRGVRSGSAIDYADMIWLPAILGLELPKVDLVLADEVQDLTELQHWMTLQAGERVVAVGDENQAIYQWRGAKADGMRAMVKELDGPVCLPLTYTRRCPKRVVKVAQQVVPAIKALAEAVEGVVEIGPPDALLAAEPGDMVLSRTNAPLIDWGYRFLAMGKRAVVKGRDVGDQVMQLVPQGIPEGAVIKDVLYLAAVMRDEKVEKFLAMPEGKGEGRAAGVEDAYRCLQAAAIGVKTLGELKRKIAQLTDDGSLAIQLSSIHRAKGLEADTVWIVEPEKIPHPMALRSAERSGKDWEVEQEWNLAYVAVTRARKRLVFCGKPDRRLMAGV